MFSTLISAPELARHLNDPDWVVVDCRFDLADTASGEAAFREGHIPGASYAHLDRDLSSPIPVTDSGRHPLPSPAAMTALFGRLGIDENAQVVVYDNVNGHYAARLWWMLRYMGHEAAAVLDGGWQAWQEAGLPMNDSVDPPRPRVFAGAPRAEMLVTVEDVAAAPLLVDARNPERYRGEIEPIDPVPGHIPGAINYPYGNNWDAGGSWKTTGELRQNYVELLGATASEDTVFYCGSGVSACVDLLALAHAGLPDGRLYVGSWSEWSSDPTGPIETGN